MESDNIGLIEHILSTQNETANSTTVDNRNEQLAQFEIATLCSIFLITVVGNSLVLLALCARKHCAGRKKLSRMYFFILHLCLADLVTAFFNVLPQLAWDITFRFKGGPFLCKAVKYGQLLGPYLSSYVLIATALDRYRAICFPLTYYSWSTKRSKILVGAAWFLALSFSLPQLVVFSYQRVNEDVWDCWATFPEPWGAKAYVTWYGISVFIIPLCVLTFTYTCICRVIWENAGTRLGNSIQLISRAKINTVKQTVAVIALYILCSSPFIAAQLWSTWDPDAAKSQFWSSSTFTIVSLLSTLNSCANPWIYLLFNKELLTALRMLLTGSHVPSSYKSGHSNSDSSNTTTQSKKTRITDLGCPLWRKQTSNNGTRTDRPCEMKLWVDNTDENGTTMTEVTNSLLPLDFR